MTPTSGIRYLLSNSSDEPEDTGAQDATRGPPILDEDFHFRQSSPTCIGARRSFCSPGGVTLFSPSSIIILPTVFLGQQISLPDFHGRRSNLYVRRHRPVLAVPPLFHRCFPRLGDAGPADRPSRPQILDGARQTAKGVHQLRSLKDQMCLAR